MRSSYKKEDVTLLLKDITGLVQPLSAEIRERRIQQGVHYCEMLPEEYTPSKEYMNAYKNALNNYAQIVADAVAALSEKIYAKKGECAALVSLVRAGIPIGILIKRYLREKYGFDPAHYAVSIIRGRGIDKNAVSFILERHSANSVQFVDGWVGKGAILGQLKDALSAYPGLSSDLAVVSDPAGLCALCGTHEDILIPSACLNAVVTGLISRTFLRSDIISKADFHGAAYYGDLAEEDLSEQFLTAIESRFAFDKEATVEKKAASANSREAVTRIAERYNVGDVNFIKPGIGETTRVLLRRVPWKVIVNKDYADRDELAHIYALARERGVDCEIADISLGNYKVCGIIKQLSDI